MERLSCLVHDNDQTDEHLFYILWKAIWGEPWALHAQTKDEIEFVFPGAVEGISDSIHKNTAYENKNKNGDLILFEEYAEDQSNQFQHFDNSSDGHIENVDIMFNNQIPYTRPTINFM